MVLLSNIFLWLLVGGSLGGQILITKKRRSGWLLWTIVDLGWIVYFGAKWPAPEAIPQVFLWTVYTVLSFIGWLVWGKQKADVEIKTRCCPRCNDWYYSEKDKNEKT